MRLLKLSAIALAIETAYGYLDTSPFFMFSTSELLTPSGNVQTASSITSSIAGALSQCPSDFYILVSQQGVTHSDYTSKSNSPALARHLSSKKTASHVRSSLSIPDVLGDVNLGYWQKTIVDTCGAHVTKPDVSDGTIPTTFSPTPHVISISFRAPDPSERMKELSQNDLYLASVLDLLPSSNYTVLYTTSTSTKGPSDQYAGYNMDATSLEKTLHMDLKRDLNTHDFSKRANNITLPEGALFERYQFFTPGIFMGFLVGFILLMILYVGISALSSLQVSYAAFDKEQGQLASKKAQ